ncbi:hypothetical protein AUC69_06055 [Methyloceanibacter superfactus]|uniref:SH3b domain-containing protein n=1 Tax=Methyloceanibacter superfactus TaxID=1774969 RepID=A0A1E3W8G6_9HYPH|nr:SH3 domain-containing protein [Methyloceanibacter superfactus]ODS01792.1 hypothetical protein AUC69_06055 [Methyloceanibacter superfactus]
MVQPALKTFKMPDMPQPQSLAQRIEAEIRLGARPEFTVSSMAERFAPHGLYAPQDALRALTDDPPARPALRRCKTWTARQALCLTRGVVVVLTAVAIAPAAILAGLLWFGALRGPAHFDSGVSRLAPAQQAAIAAAPFVDAVAPVPDFALSAPEAITAKAGEETGFAIAIAPADALPERSVVAIRDLPEGVMFSAGRLTAPASGACVRTRSRASPCRRARARPVRRICGSSWWRPTAPCGTRSDPARHRAEPRRPFLAPRRDRSRRDAHGARQQDDRRRLFRRRARYFQRAAEAGSGEAALAVGATYDPAFIAALGVQGIKPEPQAAQDWYGRAASLGVTDRAAKLEELKQAWAQSGAPQAGAAAPMAPEEAAPAAVESQPAPREDERPGPLGRLVAAASELTSSEEWVEVSSAVNMRGAASGTADTLKIMPAGAKLRVQAREGNWVQVADPATNQQGWIYRRFLKETDAP